jgi:Rrf2 family iron-sulfur cluster assembly transcriptional regulator
MFSKACEYGIKACIYIANQSLINKKCSLKSIASEIDSPEPFTAKILQNLVKNNVLSSIKGPNGGFYFLKETINEIKLKNIVFAIDGTDIYHKCGLGMKECSEKNPCPLHSQFKFIKNGIQEMLDNTSLQQLTFGLDSGITFLKIDTIS